MSQLVLSLFPGIGLLDMAFEEEGFCIVRGPDLLWGGDIRKFHPPAGKFDGVIGGPPCQAFSALRHLVKASGNSTAPSLIPEFERVVSEARPDWFLMENVPEAPLPSVCHYGTTARLVRDVWCGGETSRLRQFSFGERGGVNAAFHIETVALHSTQPRPAVVASTGGACTARRSGGAINKVRSAARIPEFVRDQGLPSGFDIPAFTRRALIKAIGNGVPLPMGRAVAKAVKRALNLEAETA